jgi:hypothetical protein
MVCLEIEYVDMNEPDHKSTPTLLAGILYMLAKHGFEAELKPGQFQMDFILGHIQPIPSEIVRILRKNGFEYFSSDSVTYTDVDGARRYRSLFRRMY